MLDGVEIGRTSGRRLLSPADSRETAHWPNTPGRDRDRSDPTLRPHAVYHLPRRPDPAHRSRGGGDEAGSVSSAWPPTWRRASPAGPQGPGRSSCPANTSTLRRLGSPLAGGRTPGCSCGSRGSDYRVVFWRGTNYIPCWVSGDGIWYTNEFNETWGNGATAAPNPCPQQRRLHVRIIGEAHDARVVVHWRYASSCSACGRGRTCTGWTDFSDEVYTIYPDGTATRSITLHSTQPMESHEFQRLSCSGRASGRRTCWRSRPSRSRIWPARCAPTPGPRGARADRPSPSRPILW